MSKKIVKNIKQIKKNRTKKKAIFYANKEKWESFSFPTLKLLSKLAVENESMEIYTYFFGII